MPNLSHAIRYYVICMFSLARQQQAAAMDKVIKQFNPRLKHSV